MDKAMEIVGKLAEALRVPAEQVWAALVAKQVIGSAAILVNLLICVLVCVVLAVILAKSWKGYKAEMAKERCTRNEAGYECVSILSAIILAILSLVTVIAATSCMTKLLTGLFAPETGAVLEILSKLGK